MYTYLLINIGTIIFPFLLSFDRKVAFFKRWRALFPSILISGGIFIIWDIWFTDMGIWSFNPDYLTGIYAFGLPLEEWLFFLTVPYACVFIYDCLLAYVKKDYLEKIARPLGLTLAGMLLVLGVVFLDRWYTTVTFLATGIWLLLNLFVWPKRGLGRFFVAYLVSMIPFFMVNGVLTALPVVMYNDMENLAMRMGTIPVEDSMYALLLLLMTINFYQYFQEIQTSRRTERSKSYV
ncbi:MAG: lycopene cyclase domain-containing protein [Bacteroidota bacterium]